MDLTDLSLDGFLTKFVVKVPRFGHFNPVYRNIIYRQHYDCVAADVFVTFSAAIRMF
ncbi:hypothetical protein CCHOA_04180 [Corynebacterium choanae]|uniref:Uncharacterized protein n=1 Tax=Corynebacterium choanae TaxID=1862358 RepID=A0A3G6J576_9CORY|nr:hypothetical protein CCHOA_04180 [Corynebacterium choanae]